MAACRWEARGGDPPSTPRRSLLSINVLQKLLEKLSERESQIITALAKRTQVSRDVNHAFDRQRSLGNRLADRVASFGWSGTFIIIFLVILLAWVALNGLILAGSLAFDPYPLIFLNLVFSMLAALRAPIIVISQKR